MTHRLAMPEVFHLYDTTLRDGSQQEGMHLSVTDKLRIAKLLDELGVTFIEGGWPGANPADTEFFRVANEKLELKNAKLVAFGSTRKAGGRAADDPLLQDLVGAGTEYVCIVAKAHDAHVYEALKTTLDENLEMIRDTVSFLVGSGKKIFVDCEHFFDGYLNNPTYALEVVRVAAEAGAQVVILCDTNGGMLPHEVGDIVSAASAIGVDLGVHCHNDSGCAVANTLTALDAGAMHVQGTINGYGERTGNMDMATLIPDLQLKYRWQVITPAQLQSLTAISHSIAEIAHQTLQPRQPFVGHSAFAHKAGLHASALRVNEDLYQHVPPSTVGNDMRMLISNMAGRANVQVKGEELGLDLSDRTRAGEVADLVKKREAAGYVYEVADASFELLVREFLGVLERPFHVQGWRVIASEEAGDEESNSEATVRLVAGGERQAVIGEGNGPVNALGDALVRALKPAFPQVGEYDLTDYKVRILDEEAGTDAVVRVLIDTTDGRSTWTTVGVGTDVIEASWEALSDAYLFGLVKGYGESAS
uniref:citramalate synthase n=1 Tax=Vaginimicrobium propionicum TaxID=1871034 RepID=UPI000970A156|nr:citramalate synthase [Vaginimicrobium propionicum]